MSAADVDDIEVLDVVIHASIGVESAAFGPGQLCARRDRAPNPVVGVDRVGERRELHQVVQFSDAFGSSHQVGSGLLPHAVASLL